jgi:AcrR family transcriptional regulator
LGATKPFVYYHFASKIDLLVEICERGTSDALAAIEEATQEPRDPPQRLEAFVRALTRMALKNHDFVATYFREEHNLPQDSIDRIRQMRKLINRRLRDVLGEGVSSGHFEVSDVGMGALMIAGMSSYAFAWYREHGRLKLEEVTEEVARAALKLVNVAGVSFAGASSAV